MGISFRTRLFLSAALIVSAVVATVMVLGWSRVLAIEVERLDDRLCLEARRLALQPPPAERLSEIEADVADKLRLGATTQLMLRVDANDDVRQMQSSQWRGSVDAANLAWRIAPNQLGPPARAERPPRPRDFAADGPPDGLRDERRNGPADGRRDGPPDRARDDRPPPRGSCSLATFAADGREWHAAKFELPFLRSVIAADLAATKAELQSAVKRALAIVIPLALFMTALGAWLLSSLMMRPINRLREAMKAVTQQALDQRLPNAGEDREFAELIAAYNTMLARLEASFRQASRFSADAAHELKTPLTILQGKIEQAVVNSDRRAVQSDLTAMLDEVGRLAMITRKLLLLSQADAGRLALNLVRCELSELLDALVADAQMLVSEQKISSAVERNLVIDGDEILLRQLFNNLISNAVRYCRPGGWIKVRARPLDAAIGGIEIIFANASLTIAVSERARFFDRFYRGDAAHNRSVDGNGLGLSLAREIARAHGGELALLPSAEDEVHFRLWLPTKTSARVALSRAAQKAR